MYVTPMNEGDDFVQAVKRGGTVWLARETLEWIATTREVAEDLSHLQCLDRAAAPEDRGPYDHVRIVDGEARATEQRLPRPGAVLCGLSGGLW